MRIPGWQASVLCILLMFVGSIRTAPCAGTDPPPERSSLRVPTPPESLPTQADFDDDRIADPLTFTAGGNQPDVEIYLSHTRTVLSLPVDAVSAVAGSLAVRDLDRDGDTDLLWQGVQAPAPPEVIVWLNDGTGQFARALPPGAVLSPPTPGPSLGNSQRTCTLQVCSLQRNPTPLGVLAFTRIPGNMTRTRREDNAARPAKTLFQQFSSGRAPPPHIS
jgi:hypothetical protein